MATALSLEERNVENLHASLKQLGVRDIDVQGVKALLRRPDPYTIGKWIMVDENKIKLQVQFNRSFGIDHYVMSFVPRLPVDHRVINGVDTKALEEKMKGADWYYGSESGPELEKEYYKIEAIEADIHQLISSLEGLRVATILWNNHVPFYAATKPALIRAYEDGGDLYVQKNFGGKISFEQAYAELRGSIKQNPTAALSSDAAISNYLTDKNKVMMTEQELTQNKREFGLIGASAACSEDLINKMKTGVAKIEHQYTTKNAVTGDEANTTFYLSKSKESNLYFLNKWDVSVKKFGTEDPVQKTFYNNDLKRIDHVLKNPDQLVTTFTHARSINYLCGRVVLNTHKNKNDRIEKVWDQAFPKEKQLNGKMKERSFHKEYGFDLQKVGEEYRRGIKCLSNPEHAERFYQSLERGNFEKATFVEKDGQEKPYYVTANIRVGYLEVYSECLSKAKPLTPEQLAEKGFVSQEFAVKVRERISHMEKQIQRQGGESEHGLREGVPGKEAAVVAASRQKEAGFSVDGQSQKEAGAKEGQTQRQAGGNSVSEKKATVSEKKQVETVEKRDNETVKGQKHETFSKPQAETVGEPPSETVGKKNNQRQKGNEDTGKPKRKVKPRIS